jgi:pimeloyl-ACP methyl ester carboxylesterase
MTLLPHVRTEWSIGVTTTNEKELVVRPREIVPAGTHTGIIAIHGHGGDAMTWQIGEPNATPLGPHVHTLAGHGNIVQSIDAGGPSAFANVAAMNAITAAYNRLISPTGLGAKGPKVALMGWSMGGGAVLNWCRRNPTLVSKVLLWTPMLVFRDGRGSTAQQNEVIAAYGGASVWYANSALYEPLTNVALFKDLPFPIHIIAMEDDTSVPYAEVTAFVAGVNQPNVTLTTFPTGGHVGGFAQVDPYETLRRLTP